MTISSTTNRAGFVCNGVTYQFPFDFKILAESDLQVYLYNTITRLSTQLTLNVDYTVEIASPGPGGTVTLTCPPGVIPGAEYTLTLLRAMPRTQEIDFVNGDDLDEQNIEGMGDRITMMVQELDNKMARTLAFPPTSGISNISVPDPVAGAFLRWNLSGDGLENATYVDPTLITISDYWMAVIDGGDTLAEALTAMGLDPSLSTLTLPDNVTISDFIKTLLDDADASTLQTSIGISDFIKTLLDDADASTLQTSIGISDFIKTLLDDTSAGAAQTTLGVSTFIKTLLDDADAAAARATLSAAGVLNTSTELETNLPIGSIVTAYATGTAPTFNTTVGLYMSAGTNYAGFGVTDNQLQGTWKARGRTGQDGSGQFFIAQRVA